MFGRVAEFRAQAGKGKSLFHSPTNTKTKKWGLVEGLAYFAPKPLPLLAIELSNFCASSKLHYPKL